MTSTLSETHNLDTRGPSISASNLIDAFSERVDTVTTALGPLVLPLGFEPLDRVLGGGIRRHDLVVLAGRPGVGKTIATLQMARNLAAGGATVVFACFEHDAPTLIGRLIAMEIGSVAVRHTDWYRMDGIRLLLSEISAGRTSLSSAAGDPLMRAALASIATYGHRLHFVRALPTETGVHELSDAVDAVRDGPTVLIVDYLQKVRALRSTTTHLEHVAEVTAGLKQASLESALSVLAVSAISATGLMRRRTHLAHLDSAVAVGYDSDVVILMNDKRPIVAANQIMNTLEQSERLRQRVVFTVEKNRGGIAPVDLEFGKDFEHFRFDPNGTHVSEQLIEDGEHDDFRQ